MVIKISLQYLLIHPSYELQRDEYLHLDQGYHLAWGYISVPPVTSWISYLIHLLGGAAFWVKLFPAIFGALTILIVAKIVETVGGGFYAMLLASVAVLLSGILRINILFQPNSLDIFSWALVFYLLIRFISTNNNKWLYLTALAFSFGFLSKYNILFLAAGLAPGLLLTPQRSIYVNRHLYFAVFIFLVLIAPNLWWQYQNGFPTVKQLKELADTQLVNVKRLDFIREQLLLFINSFFIIIAGLLAFFMNPDFKKYRFVFWTYCFSLGLFILSQAKGYYATGLYPVLIAFGAVYLEKQLATGWKIYLRPVVLLLVVGLFIPFLFIAFPIQPAEIIAKKSLRYKDLGLLRWEDGKDHQLPQDFADMIGWRDIAFLVDEAYDKVRDKKHTLVLCDNYGQAGAVNYYSVNKRIDAVSFNADYMNWVHLEQPIRNVILVQDANDDDTSRTEEKPLFDTVMLIGINTNEYSREKGTRVYLLKGAKIDVNARLRKEREDKLRF